MVAFKLRPPAPEAALVAVQGCGGQDRGAGEGKGGEQAILKGPAGLPPTFFDSRRPCFPLSKGKRMQGEGCKVFHEQLLNADMLAKRDEFENKRDKGRASKSGSGSETGGASSGGEGAKPKLSACAEGAEETNYMNRAF